MRERSILFARPLVLALLAGRKTQTRRLILPQPDGSARIDGLSCPFGIAGDRLWVREKWGFKRQFFDRLAPAEGPIVYAADGNPAGSTFVPWKPSLHMPRAACRIVLEIDGVGAERLREINTADAAAEGYPAKYSKSPVEWFSGVWDQYYRDRGLGWDANPWVWVVRFKVISAASPSRRERSAATTRVGVAQRPGPSLRADPGVKGASILPTSPQPKPSAEIVALRDELLSRLRNCINNDPV